MQNIKRKLITFLAKNLLPLVEDRDVIAFTNGQVFINKVKISREELGTLKNEVEMITSSRLYKLMNNYFAELVQKKMFVESSDVTDLVFGKSVLYALSVQNTICNNVKNAKYEEVKKN